MAKGMSIHVGVNATKAPGISVPALEGCENDASEMRLLARARGFMPVDTDEDVPIIGELASFNNVLGKIRIAAEELEAGDIFLFTFSGHGTRRGANDPAEVDMKDETLVLSDKLLVDNVLRRRLWPEFKPGVRIVMVSDSCHSGGVAMSIADGFESSDVAPSVATAGVGREWSVAAAQRAVPNRPRAQNGFRIRAISQLQAEAHFNLLAAFYQELRESLPTGPAPQIDGSVLLLAACEEHETTRDGLPNGAFTEALLEVWKTNTSQTYQQLRDGVAEKLEDTNSHPVILSIGEAPAISDTEAFRI